MTDKRKAELFDYAIAWIWEHTENHGVNAYKRALRQIGFNQAEIKEELASCNFGDE